MERFTAPEAKYRGTVNHLAFAALLFLLILSLRGTVLGVLASFRTAFSERTFITVYELLGGILYAAMFCIAFSL